MLVALVSCTFFLAPTQVNAANYSKSEAKQVRYFQNRYKKLSKKVYDENNLYTVEPNFAEPFNPGQLKAAYITTSMDYVNYYRKLCGLPSESNNDKVNRDAQIGASALAAIPPSMLRHPSLPTVFLATRALITSARTNGILLKTQL